MDSPLSFLLQFAFGLNTGSMDQIVGSPSWVSTEPLDITAKLSEDDAVRIGKMSANERAGTLQGMIRALLSERFKMQTHSEVRSISVLSLTVAKGGPKLTPTAAADPAQTSWAGLHNQRGSSEGRQSPVEYLVSMLSGQPEVGGRLVVDQTGLKGVYNFKLTWTPQNATSDTGGAPGLFTALEEQLGLKLESKKAPVSVVVIDHIDHPSEN